MQEHKPELERLQSVQGGKKVFLSYSQSDKGLLEDFKKQLSLLDRQGKLQLWDDSKISPGGDWDNAIKQELAQADIIILLVSADYIATDYLWEEEMMDALEHQKAIVVPVILRPCDWTSAPFSHLNALPKEGVPITSHSDQDAAWKEVVQGIRSMLFSEAYPASAPLTVSQVVFRAKSSLVRFFFRHFLSRYNKGYFVPLEYGPGNYTRANLLDTFAQYIPPSKFTFDDLTHLAQRVSTRKQQVKRSSLQQNMLRLFLEGFLWDDSTNVLLLADSGMGKTTFLQYLFCAFAKTYPSVHLAFVYGRSDMLQIIAGIPDKQHTVLFLDGFDENKEARHNLGTTIARLSALLRDFKKVIVSSRVQFFTDQTEEWKGLGSNRKFAQVYLSAFSRKETEAYLQKKFSGQADLLAKATQIFHASPDFFCRPLLLSWFDLLLYSKKAHYAYLFEVYETIVHEWAEHEADITEPDNFQGKRYPDRLLEFSKKLTLHLYLQHKELLKTDEFETIAAIAQKLGITQIDAQSRSFLTRNREDDSWLFSHKAFFDYFLAVLLCDQDIREEDFAFEEHPETTHFFNEMCWKKYGGKEKPPREKETLIDLGNIAQVQNFFPDTTISSMPNRAIRAMLTRVSTAEWAAFPQVETTPSPYWKDIIAFLKSLQPKQDTVIHYVFQDYQAFEKAIKNEGIDDLQTQSYGYTFLAEYVHWKHSGFRKHNALALNSAAKESSFKIHFAGYDFSRSFKNNLPECLKIFDVGDLFDHALSYNRELQQFVRQRPNTDFSTLGISNLTFLRYIDYEEEALDLSGNLIAVPHPALERFVELRSLDLSGNGIASAEVLRPVLELPELQTLYISNNPVDAVIAETDRRGNCLLPLREKVLTKPNMVFVEGGIFEMGQPDKKIFLFKRAGKDYYSDDEQPVHKVQLDSFYFGKYAVTVGEFRRFIAATAYETEAEKDNKGSYVWDFDKGEILLKAGVNWRCDAHGQPQTNDRHPVIHVSWEDCKAYCDWLSLATGLPYRLPTEAEWEYAAKGGPNKWAHTFQYAGSNDLDEVGWFYGNSGMEDNDKGTHPVGKKKANVLGLFDLSGNISEWCGDWYAADYYAECHQVGVMKNPSGLLNGDSRVLRGGDWGYSAALCRLAFRGYFAPSYRFYGFGFRLACSLQ